LFDRAYVANPVCMPNRATIATGRWPSAHGTHTNGVTLDPDAQTVQGLLLAAGWTTAAVGKLHFQTMGWPWEPFQREEIEAVSPLLLDPDVPDAFVRRREAGWDSFERAALHRERYVELPSGYYGFGSVDLVVGHGDRATGHYTHWARERGLDPDLASGPARSSLRFAEWQEIYRSEIPPELYPTSYVVERTIARLEKLSEARRPFLLFCSFPDPHHPFSPPGRYFELYDPETMALPRSFSDPLQGAPEHLKRLAQNRGKPGLDPTMTWAPNEAQLRHALAAEFGSLAMIDEGIGKILTALEKLGLGEDTTVIFTSDHGDMFGEHGLMLKHFVHYQSVIRVPLIIRCPGRERRLVKALASSADIAPTILELAGVKAHRGIQGASLVALLDGHVKQLREQVVIEEDQPFSIDGLRAPVRIRTLVTERARCTVYAGMPVGELYDLAADPDEMTNLWGLKDHQQLKVEMMERLIAELARVADGGIEPAASA